MLKKKKKNALAFMAVGGNQIFVTWASLKVCSQWYLALSELLIQQRGKVRAQDGSHLTMFAGHYRFRWPAWSHCKTEPHKLGTQWQPHRTIWGFWPLKKPVVLISMTFWTTVLYVSSESAREERLLERLSHWVSLRKEARRQSFWTSNWHPFL